MSNMMLIEKSNTKEELIKTLLELIKITGDKEMLKWLEKVVRYILPDMLGEEQEVILENIKRKEVGNMEYYDNGWCSRITRNEKRKEARLIREGKRETILEIIKNMLRLKQDEKTIMRFTNAKQSDIEKAKRELQML